MSLYFPSSVYLGLSYLCNMHCEHCYAIGSDRSASLTHSEVRRLIDDLEQLFCCNVIFGHGEPFIYPGFLDILRYIKSKSINTIVMTNGSMLTAQRVEELVDPEVRPHLVKVSLDSRDPSFHDTNRNQPGAFNKAVEAIRRLRDADVDTKIAAVIDVANPWTAVPLIDFAIELGLSGISMLAIRDKRQYSAQQLGEYVRAVKEILLHAKDAANFQVLLHDPMIFSLLPKSEVEGVDWERVRLENECTAGTERIAIQPDGTVTPCNLMPDTVIGNIREQSLIDLWNDSPYLQRIRQSFLSNDIVGCQNCSHHPVCHGGCLAFGSVEPDKIIKDYRCTGHGTVVQPHRTMLGIL